MKNYGLSNYQDLVVFYMQKARDMLAAINPNKQALYWSNTDTFYQRYRPQDILVYWDLAANITNFTATYPNNSYVMCPVDFYYLDCSFGNKYGGGSWCDPMKTWWRIYDFEPTDFSNSSNVIGSEVPVWSEIMSQESVHVKIWPRAAAMADRLWGQKPAVVDVVGISQRQIAFGNYLMARGIPVSHISGQWCEVYPEHCFAKNGTILTTTSAEPYKVDL
jgi:hexosaminidase